MSLRLLRRLTGTAGARFPLVAVFRWCGRGIIVTGLFFPERICHKNGPAGKKPCGAVMFSLRDERAEGSLLFRGITGGR